MGDSARALRHALPALGSHEHQIRANSYGQTRAWRKAGVGPH
jgi:hypothetical protein